MWVDDGCASLDDHAVFQRRNVEDDVDRGGKANRNVDTLRDALKSLERELQRVLANRNSGKAKLAFVIRLHRLRAHQRIARDRGGDPGHDCTGCVFDTAADRAGSGGLRRSLRHC